MKSTDIIKPTPLIAPIANDGLKNTIPDNATGSNYASIAEGFPEMTMKAPKDGGLPPWGQDFNGMFYLMSSQTCFLQNGGIITFDQDVSNKIGGYPQGAILDYMTPENSYVKVKSLIDNNTYNFVTTPSYIDGEHWEEITISATTSWGNITGTLSNQTDLTDYVNQSKALETGSVSSDADVYADIQKYAHSTFDLSKFEVVGTPTITDNGIASGFSSTSYIELPEQITTDLQNANNWEIEFPVTFADGTISTRQEIFGGSIGSSPYSLIIRLWDGGHILVNVNGDTLANNFQLSSINVVAPNTEYLIKIKVENNVMYYYLNGELQASQNLMEKVTFKGTLRLGVSHNLTNYFQGSINLKSFSISTDGVSAISGNKTGIDIIKPDNYEVVGTPTISDDGIASGLDNTNYLTTTLNLSGEVIIKGSFNPNGTNPTSSAFIVNIQDKEENATEGVYLYQLFNGRFEFYYRHNNTSYYNIGQFSSNTEFNYIIIINSTSLQCIVYQNTNEIYNKTITSNIPVLNGEFIYKIGSNALLQGSVDLNSVQILNNGNLIYQPCLKIPYTLSKTGSKIVDVAYRDRVQDMYKQYGYAPYYTIDEENENFTLPMGEIYGMIERKTEILNTAYPIGSPLPDVNNQLADNEIWLEGATVSRIDYVNLFNIYGTTYGEGDGSTTFQLPDLRNRVLWGSSDGSKGYIEASIPNITAKWGNLKNGIFNNSQTSDGAVIATNGGGIGAGEGASGNQTLWDFDASRISSVYSNDAATVQPPAFKVRWKTRFK